MSKRKILLLAFGVCMFTALVYEVIWTRNLNLVFGTSIYAFSAVLSSFMMGLALSASISPVFESNGIMKFELTQDQKIAFMFVCEENRHLYFISLLTTDNSPENEYKLREIVSSIGCLLWPITCKSMD